MKFALKIYGMDCVACSNQVRTILKRIKDLNCCRIIRASSCFMNKSNFFSEITI